MQATPMSTYMTNNVKGFIVNIVGIFMAWNFIVLWSLNVTRFLCYVIGSAQTTNVSSVQKCLNYDVWSLGTDVTVRVCTCCFLCLCLVLPSSKCLGCLCDWWVISIISVNASFVLRQSFVRFYYLVVSEYYLIKVYSGLVIKTCLFGCQG